ncbi:hypothetical protein HZC08_01560, partial [Candidatus Micrarchaeota archaeon]|nr:hypothetical protein [Candidatus Micrarchaeota archaeon]
MSASPALVDRFGRFPGPVRKVANALLGSKLQSDRFEVADPVRSCPKPTPKLASLLIDLVSGESGTSLGRDVLELGLSRLDLARSDRTPETILLSALREQGQVPVTYVGLGSISSFNAGTHTSSDGSKVAYLDVSLFRSEHLRPFIASAVRQPWTVATLLPPDSPRFIGTFDRIFSFGLFGDALKAPASSLVRAFGHSHGLTLADAAMFIEALLHIRCASLLKVDGVVLHVNTHRAP